MNLMVTREDYAKINYVCILYQYVNQSQNYKYYKKVLRLGKLRANFLKGQRSQPLTHSSRFSCTHGIAANTSSC